MPGSVRRRFRPVRRSAQVRTFATVTPTLDLADVQRQLHLTDAVARWLDDLDTSTVTHGPTLPDDAEAERLLALLSVTTDDRAEALAARPDPQAHKAHWWILDRICRDTLATLGRPVTIEGFRAWQNLAASPAVDAVTRYLYVWAYLALLPEARRHHQERGIPDDISWNTFALDLALSAHRAATGEGGLSFAWGPPIRLRCAYYTLGRLEYNRAELSLGNGPCGYAISVHIPANGGLRPDAVEDSLAQAREFFRRYYPEEAVAFFTCASWLMDPQLADYLPADSNLVRFQRRFQLVPLVRERDGGQGDQAILRFIFDKPGDTEITPEALDQLPQETTLQRAYVRHLRAGRHWDTRTGWIPIDSAP